MMSFLKGYRRISTILTGIAILVVNNFDLGVNEEGVNLIATNIGNMLVMAASLWSVVSPEPAKVGPESN